MRTTLTLDPDVAAAIERIRKERDASLKSVVNEALREGVRQLSKRARARGPRRATRTVALGRCRLGNLDNVAEGLATVEHDTFK